MDLAELDKACGVEAVRTYHIEEPVDTCLDVAHEVDLSIPSRRVLAIDEGMASSMSPVEIPLSASVLEQPWVESPKLPRSRDFLVVVDMRLVVVELPTAEADIVLNVDRLTLATDAGDI